jgi:polyisoprenoid-binding protein YceI
MMQRSKMTRIALALLALVAGSTVFAADGPCVIGQRGRFQIRTGTAGLFGAFAHEHLVEAQKIEGCATIDLGDLGHSSIKLTFSTPDIRVIDPKESASDRAKIQKTMESEVLGVSEFPQVTFESTAIERGTTADGLSIRGRLTIRGKTQPVTIPVTLTRLQDGAYRAAGEYRFKQTSFGIKPIQLAGGTVKVKDEILTEFELFLK